MHQFKYFPVFAYPILTSQLRAKRFNNWDTFRVVTNNCVEAISSTHSFQFILKDETIVIHMLSDNWKTAERAVAGFCDIESIPEMPLSLLNVFKAAPLGPENDSVCVFISLDYVDYKLGTYPISDSIDLEDLNTIFWGRFAEKIPLNLLLSLSELNKLIFAYLGRLCVNTHREGKE